MPDEPLLGQLPFELRQHQKDSVAAHLAAATGRSHLVLPPGAGKTAVGVAIALHEQRRALVLVPNTAIQQQWIDLWRATLTDPRSVCDDRSMSGDVTVLTYQSIATFDPDADEDAPMTERLHPNAAALLERLRDGERFTLLLDEAHHLLHTWGRLLDEVLARVAGGPAGDPVVVALTATPQTRLTGEQAELAQRLFGPVLHEVSTPALVRSGVLAPFRELVWFVEPTPVELAHLAASAQQWEELIADLLDPQLASVGFLEHLNRTWVHRADGTEQGVPWPRVVKQDPELALALLRLHHHRGLIDRPDGARLTAQAREPMVVADWVALIEDYATRVLLDPDADAQDRAAHDSIRRALPAVGWTLTRRGARPGRSPADRVLAHSSAKAQGVAALLVGELAHRAERMRAVVITDFEQLAATGSARLAGSDAPVAGSAWEVLDVLVGDPRLGAASPLLVTGRSCAGPAASLLKLHERVAASDPDLASGLEIQPAPQSPGLFLLTGPGWNARRWVAATTAALQASDCPVLIGTRGLLGEGWDAASVNVLIDATMATTPTSVVQVRGRALRRDPVSADKVAHIYTLVAVADDHPLGEVDYQRFVSKHDGFLAADSRGRITAGVGHVSAELEPSAAPDDLSRAAVNAEVQTLVGRTAEVPQLWGVGEPYRDVTMAVAQVTASRTASQPPDFDALQAMERTPPVPLLAGLVLAAGTAGAVAGAAGGAALPAAAAAAGLTGLAGGSWAWARWRASVRTDPGDLLAAIGAAVAAAAGQPWQDVAVNPDGAGIWRVGLEGAQPDQAQMFAEAVAQVLAPVDNPRYLISRRLPRKRVEVWHAVPDQFGRNKDRATVFEGAWRRHVSRSTLLFSGSPEGAGVLAAVQGLNPLDAACGLRVEWR